MAVLQWSPLALKEQFEEAARSTTVIKGPDKILWYGAFVTDLPAANLSGQRQFRNT